MTRSSRPEAVVVLDVGRTEVRLLAIAPEGRLLSMRSAPNEVRRGGAYPSCDTEHIWRWMMAALADLGERFAFQAIVPTSYGSTAALIDPGQLILPILDYAADPPPEIADAYVEVAPWFEECCCPVNPASVTLGRQLFWLSQEFPEAFERARWILPFAQYWAWGLSGVPASEVTSLGAQTQLWDPRERALSSLVWQQGWADKIPPLRNAWDVLGPLQFEIASRCGLPDDIPVLCGIYASGANLSRYIAAGLDEVTLVSTGDWVVAYQPDLPLAHLEPLRETAAIVDLLGRPVACARFMGGREHAALAWDHDADDAPTVADVEALLAAGTMALPSFASAGGPFPGTSDNGRIVGPMPEAGRARAALASLYLALMTSACLDLLRSRGQVIVDGPFAEDPLFTGLLAALRPGQPVAVSTERHGAGLGAALLWGWPGRTTAVRLDLSPVAAPRIAGLAPYERRWRKAAEAAAGG